MIFSNLDDKREGVDDGRSSPADGNRDRSDDVSRIILGISLELVLYYLFPSAISFIVGDLLNLVPLYCSYPRFYRRRGKDGKEVRLLPNQISEGGE